jgi:DNA-binding GntR family transcriptional regulator
MPRRIDDSPQPKPSRKGRRIADGTIRLTNKQRAYRYIRDRLQDQTLAAGQRLSSALLAKEMGISLIPVREALSQLHSEGLVAHKPHRGMFVRQLDREVMEELFEV